MATPLRWSSRYGPAPASVRSSSSRRRALPRPSWTQALRTSSLVAPVSPGRWSGRDPRGTASPGGFSVIGNTGHIRALDIFEPGFCNCFTNCLNKYSSSWLVPCKSVVPISSCKQSIPIHASLLAPCWRKRLFVLIGYPSSAVQNSAAI